MHVLPILAQPHTAGQLIEVLERCRAEIPFADEELARHRTLCHAISEQRTRGEATLAAWRLALSHRWECEVNAQRVYSSVQRQLSGYFANDSAYLQLVVPAHPGAAQTANDLLGDMRRLEAYLSLLRPRPPFAEESRSCLHAAADELADAIDGSERCESERRNVLIEQRMATNLYAYVYEKTRRLVADHIAASRS